MTLCRLALLLLLPTHYAAPTHADDAPCCVVCHSPRAKYFSVDGKHDLCGEACLLPALFPLFKYFEKNLTAAASRDEHACSKQLSNKGFWYSRYNGTVTHGVPGALEIQLDLYAPPVLA